MPTLTLDEARRKLEKGEAILARQRAEGAVNLRVVRAVEALRKALPPEPAPDPCRACGSRTRWESIHGFQACVTCHPPASPGLVRRVIGVVQ